MKSNYDHKEIEKKWQEKWSKDELYKTETTKDAESQEYILTEFPYPSGNLHVGHWYAFAIPDIYARYRRMLGKKVLFPMGFDAFGLPAENAAIKHNLNPRDWTYKNMEDMKVQINSMGTVLDWSHEIATCDPSYYKWTQWLFLQLYKNSLIYQGETPVNWCPSCKTVLANEQVVDGKCERCDSEVEQKNLNQWQARITKFADDLVDDLDELDWPEEIKHSQRNWIGRSNGSFLEFKIKNREEKIKVFTTRTDTLFGVTYLVLAPEHNLIDELKSEVANLDEVQNYVKKTGNKTELDRLSDNKEKTGVELNGVIAINPVNNEEIPVYIADYVLANYGTGAVMAVPSHDERDHEFAKKYGLPLRKVIESDEEFFGGLGKLINSEEFNGLESEEAKTKITEKVGGELNSTYRLRDWVMSRQRYWGCPIPIIHCKDCGAVPVEEKDLPVELPDVEDYLPRDDGKSPLAKATDWMNVKCPKCGKDAERETDTLDTFVDSSWYFLRYIDSENKDKFATDERIKKWLPVDFYSGGAEHTTMHVLYARFFTKALNSIGILDFNEPFTRRMNRGLILGPDNQKMSKSKGNVIDPDKEVQNVGADTVRMYLAFIGPFNEVGSYPWDPNGVVGIRRFLERILDKSESFVEKTDEEVLKELHKTIKKCSEDCSRLKFNTAIAQMMTFINKVDDNISKEDYSTFVKVLAPFAPHLAEEIWSNLGNTGSVHIEKYPEFNPDLVEESEVEIGVQVNGKVRGSIKIGVDEGEDSVKSRVLADTEISKWTEGKDIKKFIFIPGKIVNIVV